MIGEEKIIEKWNLRDWCNRVDAVEDVIAEIAETKQSSGDINQLLLFRYGRVVLCLKEMLTLLMHGIS